MAEYRTVNFRQTDYATGCVSNEEVEAPIVARYRDHDVVELPDGSRLPVQKPPVIRFN
jgi:hypothetical protein